MTSIRAGIALTATLAALAACSPGGFSAAGDQGSAPGVVQGAAAEDEVAVDSLWRNYR